MNAFLTSLSALMDGLLKLSAQASLVIVVVLVAQWLGRKHLSPRVRYALWLLVVARLMLPVSFESNVSIFNYAKAARNNLVRSPERAKSTAPVNVDSAAMSAPIPPGQAASAAMPPAQPINAATVLPSKQPERSLQPSTSYASRDASDTSSRRRPWALTLSLVWLGGVVFLLVRIIWIPLRLNARLARHETATTPAVFEVLEQSKRLVGVNQVLPIVQSRAVQSPALLGFIRPWLLLPEGLVEKFTPQELRFVFLHELAHLKRRDIAVNWLITLLQILHWFNPLVWYAFARMRADRELACDELALSFARADENKSYGRAIIKLLEGFTRPAALPGLVGILEDQQHMKRRITMIAQFKKMTQWSAAAAGLLLVLGLVTLTDAQTEKIALQETMPLASASVRTLASGSAMGAVGLLAPDESAFIYTDWNTHGIVLCELATGEKRTLTGAESPDGNPPKAIWSADSKTIAYSWELHSKDHQGPALRTVSRDGGAPKIIRETDSDCFFPEDWSRDGTLMVGERFSYGHGNEAGGYAGLAIETVATGELRSLGLGGMQATHARFSPDGRLVAYARIVDGNSEVFVVSVDGTKTTRITDSPAQDTMPIFSADGRYVLFSSNRRGTWDLWASRVENGIPFGPHSRSSTTLAPHPNRLPKRGNWPSLCQADVRTYMKSPPPTSMPGHGRWRSRSSDRTVALSHGLPTAESLPTSVVMAEHRAGQAAPIRAWRFACSRLLMGRRKRSIRESLTCRGCSGHPTDTRSRYYVLRKAKKTARMANAAYICSRSPDGR